MKLIIVSNRLPVVVEKKDEKLNLKMSAGGLVSGLTAYLDSVKGSSSKKGPDFLWIGWPEISPDEKTKKLLKTKELPKLNAYPVFIPEESMDKYYHGFCNNTIWPLFHYFPSYTVFDHDLWKHYKIVNNLFYDAVTEVVEPDDIVWVHDYHLMLLPNLLRQKYPKLAIGFFLHIPFPTFEIFRLLPGKWREEILQGILGADLIGFHTHDYTQYFLRCVLRILGYENNMGKLIYGDRIIKAETFPMGIDYDKYHNGVTKPAVQKNKDKLLKMLSDMKVVLSIDRLDYTKGIINRLIAYEKFLTDNPRWHGKVILVIIVVPSRTGVEQYRQMKKQIDEMVGKINGRFGKMNWIPILYQYRSLPFESLVALYSVSDIALITPLRDGMNLIAKEYIASRREGDGVLILSEMAGTAKELGEAVIINPNDIEEISDALKEALEKPLEEQIESNKVMQERIKRYNIVKWAEDFMQQLLLLKSEQRQFSARLLNSKAEKKIISKYKKAKRRLLILDYEGTIIPFSGHPQRVAPNRQVISIIKKLAKDKKNMVVIMSGSEKTFLEDWFGKIKDVALVAENGSWIKGLDGEWRVIKPLTNDWKEQIVPILKLYSERLPGSFVEEKEYSASLYYRKADTELSLIRAKELLDDLVEFTANLDVQISRGYKVIAVTNSGVNKGTACLHWIKDKSYDFIFAAGDNWTDEELFKLMPFKATSIRIGIVQSYADYNLQSYEELLNLLKKFIGEEQL
ncbi:MAG: bifunctional alpha,alpha-trehalose-phosphate synthase (UDP-forming)/trehalose-phosphatase [Candidatus Schekmanbacteria bacterium]|nr:MAG: bifunctional alpha,alpha-trehalose-phosphate synthase (UDP-forming)/trehalose-phosphatase [Candidatus Schekmanbacteria bacterium]